MQTYVSWNLYAGRESYLYFGACFELLTKCGWIKPLYRQARGDLEIQRFLGIILKN